MAIKDQCERIIKIQGDCIRDAVTVAEFMIQQIWESFSYQLKVKSLAKYIPQSNAKQLHTLNQQFVAYFYLQGQSTSETQIITEDTMPKTIPKDTMVSIFSQPLLKQDRYQLTRNNQSLILPLKLDTPYSLSYSLSKDEVSGMINADYYKVGQFKMTSQMTNSNINIIKSSNLNNHPHQLSFHSYSIPLTFPVSKQQYSDSVEQRQLQHLKKNLYAMRRYRRISIEQQRQSFDKLNKKKSHLLLMSKAQHTYDYDGKVIEKRKTKVGNNCQKSMSGLFHDDNSKPTTNRSSPFGNVTELHTSIKLLDKVTSKRVKHSLNSRSKFINLPSSSFIFDKLPIYSQDKQQQNTAFNNCNKRQVSHLPYISLIDNSKIIENNSKQLSGCVTQRSSLHIKKKSQQQLLNNGDYYNIDNSSRKFRFFSQIEFEKKKMQKSKHKVMDVSEQQGEFIRIGIMPQTILNKRGDNPEQEQPRKKQSKMMLKYLKKITEQKCKIQRQISQDANTLKSLNFNNLAVPQKYPIQRYYQYDFEGEIKSYEYSISSKLSTKRNSLSLVNQTDPN